MLEQLIYELKQPYHFFKTGLFKGLPAQIKTGFPNRKIKILAITGTDGKTTSSSLLYHVLKSAGKKVALISTVAAYINEAEIDTGFHVTSPAPNQLYQFMQKMREEEVEYLVLEYTSQGAYQNRLWGIKPLIAAVTNIDQDHFDYHLNYQNYLEAKALVLKLSKTIVLNEDDQSYYRLRKILPSSEHQILNYSKEEKLARNLQAAVKERFPEAFNQMNARLVIKVAESLGLDNKEIAKAIESFPGVKGRMQIIDTKKLIGKKTSFEIVIDFAHTPQGLESALTALKTKMKTDGLNGRLIAVYGCAGLRDADKRPQMGKIGTDLADLVVFTAEDPRTEDVWTIIRQMKENLTENHRKIVSVPDRQEAISFALQKLAKKGDLIAILGKGPEKSMCYGNEEIPWSDLEAVKTALK